MKSKKILVITLFIFILCTVGIFFFRIKPVISPWKGWRVLTVSAAIPESKVLKELSDLGFNSVISESTERLPVNSKLAPVLPKDYDFYEENLYRYFYDESQNYKIYYIKKPVSSGKLKKLSFNYNLDLPAKATFLGFILISICFVLLVLFTKNKFITGCCGFPFILYGFCSLNFTSMIASLFCFLILFITDRFYKRKNLFKAALKNPFVIISFFCAFLVNCLTGLSNILLFLITLLSTSANFISSNILISLKQKSSFEYKLILKADSMPETNKLIKCLYYLSGIIIVTGLFFIFEPSILTYSKQDTHLSIPTPLEYTGTGGFSLKNYENLQEKKKSTEIPDLGDYISHYWNAGVFPYIPLQKNKGFIDKVIPNASVKSVEYFKEDGEIKTKETDIAVFSNQFIKNSLEKISSNENEVIEKVLLDQNRFCATDYNSVNKNNTKSLTLLITAFLFALSEILLFFKHKVKVHRINRK